MLIISVAMYFDRPGGQLTSAPPQAAGAVLTSFASVVDVMEAMGIEGPVVRADDLLAGAEFAQQWD
jgi:hypothetical protein